VFPGDGSYLMMSSSLLIGANSEAVILGSAAILHKTRQEYLLHEMLIGTALPSHASFQMGNNTFETKCNYPLIKVKQTATVRHETTWNKHKDMHF
jgi:hypothetical protein